MAEEGLLLADDGEISVEWVIAGLDRDFDYAKLTCATRAILAGARFVATNADALLPVEGGQVIPGAGSIVAAIQTATAVVPVVVGKPEPGLFEHGLHRLGDLLPEQVAMIGDRLDTDVVGGQRAGLRTILVLSGVTTAAEVKAASSQPDAIAPDLAAVAGLPRLELTAQSFPSASRPSAGLEIAAAERGSILAGAKRLPGGGTRCK